MAAVQYKLYNYRKYSDVRLVWVPEAQAAQFGGDPDNFNFPRYSLDASFLRAYEDGKPVATPQHLEWSARAPVDGEATFVVGNPGSTQRLFTSEQLAFQRELVLPITVTTFSERRGRLIAAMESDPAKMREGIRSWKASRTASKSISAASARWAIRPSPAAWPLPKAQLKAKSAGNQEIGNPWGDIAKAMAALPDLLRRRPLFTAVRATCSAMR
jgi:hypothetical protein